MYTIDGRLLEVPEGAQPVEINSLPGEPMVDLPLLLVEEVQLPRDVVVVRDDGSSYRQDIAWRLTVASPESGFGVGALPWFIWVGELPHFAVQTSDLKQLTAVSFDPAVVQAGTEIKVSYGLSSERRAHVAFIPSEE